MPSTDVNFFQSSFFLVFFKASILIILVFYSLFAILIVRQTSLMVKTLTTSISPLFRDLAIYHAILSFILIGLVWKFL